MCKAIDEMIEKGVQRGKREGKIEDIFELLSDLGEVDVKVKEQISHENDTSILRRWHKLAARSSSIAEFEAAM